MARPAGRRRQAGLTLADADTIVARSSGAPPAAIAVLRVSGPGALGAVGTLAGTLPRPRVAGLRGLRDAGGALLDRVLVLVFPGPASATGEDLVELHCHGGRAVVAAVEGALLATPGVRRAEPGEFTRRALANGRIDLAEAEGLADLLAAETEAQRRAALAVAEGLVSRELAGWMERLSVLAARVEVAIDYGEEGADEADPGLADDLDALAAELATALARPPVERLRDGVRVVIAGPPNAGKSTLLNALAERDVAIVSPIAGTTRDRIEAPVRRGGIAFVLADTAGLTETADPIEAIGVARAEEAMAAADVLLWLGEDAPPRDALRVHARADLPERARPPAGALPVSARTGEGVAALWDALAEHAAALLPSLDAASLSADQRAGVGEAARRVDAARRSPEPLVAAEELRLARRSLARLLGVDATEAMLDRLFARFCLGK